MAAAVVGALSFEGLKSEFDSLASFADDVQNAQARMGGTLQDMTTLSGVAAMTGVSFKSLSADVAEANLQVQRSASDAYGPAAQGLRALGLSARELAGLPVDQWFEKVADAVSRFNPSVTLTANVQQAFGRGFAELMPLLVQASDHFREVKEAVEEAQDGLSRALPGISETEEKLTLLGLRSRAFAAEIFSALKPAIDAAIDGFSQLTASIAVDNIRDAAGQVANYLIDLAASVARFFAEAGFQVDLFKAKWGGITLGLPKQDEADLKWILGGLAKLTGDYDRVKDVLEQPLPACSATRRSILRWHRPKQENAMPWTGPVLPALPGISYPRKRTPTWSKVDSTALSGKRVRTTLFTYPLYAYELPLNYLRTDANIAEWQQLIGFINSLQGGVGLFGYTDPDDNAIANQAFGEGDGSTTGPFQLVRQLGNFVEPVFLLNGAPAITVAGVPTMAFTVDNYGRVTFSAAPAAGAALTWSGSYYWPCRFDEDTTEMSKFLAHGVSSTKSL